MRTIGILAAALFLLFAVTGCGDSETSRPANSPTPTAAAGPSGNSGATTSPSAPSADAATPKLDRSGKRFAAKLNALCRKYDSSEAEFYYINTYAQGEIPTDEIDSMATSYRGLLMKAGELRPPAESKAEFETYLASLRSLIVQTGPLRAAHKSGDADRTDALDIAFSEELLKRSNAALALGAENCIMDSAD
ncbi:MAG: hypothetical protein JHC98_00300 [Thermoleophilaceae bacterium]|nr:hypothetical protein [Thermoleophilaceae bacterium]